MQQWVRQFSGLRPAKGTVAHWRLLGKRHFSVPLRPDLQRGWDSFGYDKPTVIQDLYWQSASSSSSKSTVLRAPTGTGKTLAFLVPAANAVDEKLDKIQVLIVSPSRELALQTAQVAQRLLAYSSTRSSFVVGGFSVADDIERMKCDRPHILSVTPGKLCSLLERTPGFVQAFSHLKMLILDEADHLLGETGFTPQVDYIRTGLPAMSTTLCSATFPVYVRKWAERQLANAHVVEEQKVMADIDQRYVKYEPSTLASTLVSALNAHSNRTLVIFPTARLLQFCYVLVKHYNPKVVEHRPLYALHSRLQDAKRSVVCDTFRKPGRGNEILFATDLAARGLDFVDVEAVIQIGLGFFGKDQYVHRCGRAGRSSGKTAISVLLYQSCEEKRVHRELGSLNLQPLEMSHVAADFDGWWNYRHFFASSDMAYRSLLGFLQRHKADYGLTTADIAQIAEESIASFGRPPSTLFPPALSRGLATKLLLIQDNVPMRLSSTTQQLDFLASLPSFENYSAPTVPRKPKATG
eukprot:GEMP01020135.1.p1 GENE.GEMP01020135.1~~GEMP01020135.1.p1  ORF type:complete len:522 (+),score=114.81 GEMP01020135.1:155-1720(+)